MGNTKWRSEPTDVEKSADEVWLGVKCQSNTEIAGSLRNASRCSVIQSVQTRGMLGVEH